MEKTITVRNGMFETKLRTDGDGAPLLFLHGAGGLRGWDPFLVEKYTVSTLGSGLLENNPGRR